MRSPTTRRRSSRRVPRLVGVHQHRGAVRCQDEKGIVTADVEDVIVRGFNAPAGTGRTEKTLSGSLGGEGLCCGFDSETVVCELHGALFAFTG